MEALTASAAASVVIMPDVLDAEIGSTIIKIKGLRCAVEEATKKADADTEAAKAVFDNAATTAAETKTMEDRAIRDTAAQNLKKVTLTGRESVAAFKKELNDLALKVCTEAATKLKLVLSMKDLGEIKVVLIRYATSDGENLADLRKLLRFFCGSDALVAFDVELNQWATDAKVMKYTDGDVKYTLYITRRNENNVILPAGHHKEKSSIPLVVHVTPNPSDPSRLDIVRVCVQGPTELLVDLTNPAKLQYLLRRAYPDIFAENDSCAFPARIFSAMIMRAHALMASPNPEDKAAGEKMYAEVMALRDNQKCAKELRKQIENLKAMNIEIPQTTLDEYDEARSKSAPGSMIRQVLKGPLSPVVNQELIAALAIYHIEAVALGDMSDVEKVACIADRRNAERLAAKQASAKLAADKKAAAKAATTTEE
jgi:hypothetical protein